MDFFRVYSTDYPYVEGKLHDDYSRMTMLFNGREDRTSTSVTFSLTAEGKSFDTRSNRTRKSMPSEMNSKDV